MDFWEILVSGVVGALLGALIGAVLRPHVVWLERLSRKVWKEKPVSVHIERDRSIIWAGYVDWIGDSVYVRGRSQLVGIPPNDRDRWAEWARSQGAVDAGRTEIKVVIWAQAHAAVAIRGLNVKIHKREQVKQGEVIVRGVGGASVVPKQFKVDLDWGPTSQHVTWLNPGGSPGQPPSLMLSAGEIDEFHICANVSHETARFEWSLILNLLVEGRMVRQEIDNNGSPFVTVGGGGLPHFTFDYEREEWIGGPLKGSGDGGSTYLT